MRALPDELILAILADHVPLPELANCALVCQRWRRMFNSRSLRRYHNARFASQQCFGRRMDSGILSYADLDVRNVRGETPLHVAAAEGTVATADFLLERIYSEARLAERIVRFIESIDDRGQTPLLVAVAKTNLGVAKKLLERGANANAHDARGRTPIHRAVESGHAEMVRMLISYSAHLDVIDCFQMTPLHIAAYSKRQSSFGNAATTDHPSAIEIVRILLDKGSDLTAEDVHGQTPLHLASLWSSEIFEILLNQSLLSSQRKSRQRSPSTSSMATATSALSHTAVTHRSGMSGSEVDEERTIDHPSSIRDRAGHNSLHRAAQLGNFVAVQAILRHTEVDSPTLPRTIKPVDVNAVTLDKRRTALHHACSVGNLDCVRALIAAGADLSAVDADEWTPMDHAKCGGGLADCSRELVKAGAKRGPARWALPIRGYRSILGGERFQNRNAERTPNRRARSQ